MIWFVLLMFVPLIGAALFYLYRHEQAQTVINIGTAAVVLVASILAFLKIRDVGSLTWIPNSIGVFHPAFRLDALSALFSLFSAVVWFATAVYMRTYMGHEQRTLSFSVFFLVTLGAVQGIFAAGNLVTLLVFFEVMTVSSFFWVIHSQDDESYRAGYFYLFLGVAAGLFIATGIVLLKEAGVSLDIGVVAANPLNPIAFAFGVMLLIAGLGVKAGMVPLHIWLPMAHPVAPSPGSALLSGILIKCGAYGIIRVGQMLDWGQIAEMPWIGVTMTIIGVVTMVLGVCLALLQANAKRLLAYHSVSQMGYILLGIGLALFLKSDGALGVTGAIFHSLNHALFKSALFLGAGIILMGTGELNLYKLGGLWRRYPFTGLMMLIAAFGITGTPGLNGYLSKTLLHHAVSEAAGTGSPVMVWAEQLFLVVGVGTTASFVKLIALMFLGKQKTEVDEGAGEGIFLSFAMGLLATVMLFIGTHPDFMLQQFIMPAAEAAGMSHLEHVAHVNFWAPADLQGMAITLGAGIIFCWLGIKSGLFHYHPPAWLSLEFAGKLILSVLVFAGRCLERGYVAVSSRVFTTYRRQYQHALAISRRVDHQGGGIFSVINFSNMNFDAFLLLALLAVLGLYYFRLGI